MNRKIVAVIHQIGIFIGIVLSVTLVLTQSLDDWLATYLWLTGFWVAVYFGIRKFNEE